YDVKFKPTMLLKKAPNVPAVLDVSANFEFNEKFTIGAAYRTTNAVSLLSGFRVSNQFFLGYSYDYDINLLGGNSYGSHELFMRFDIGESRKKFCGCPTFF